MSIIPGFSDLMTPTEMGAGLSPREQILVRGGPRGREKSLGLEGKRTQSSTEKKSAEVRDGRGGLLPREITSNELEGNQKAIAIVHCIVDTAEGKDGGGFPRNKCPAHRRLTWGKDDWKVSLVPSRSYRKAAKRDVLP